MNQGNPNFPQMTPFYYFNQSPYGQMGFPGMPGNFMPNQNVDNFQQQYDMKNMKNNEEMPQAFYGGYPYFNKQA
jgi:hypothetical protein